MCNRSISPILLALLVAGFGLWPAPSALATTLDYGDAPDTPYPTIANRNGARHAINQSIRLGARLDGEVDGQPNVNATGDDLIPSDADDEDGVVFLTPLLPGQAAQVEVTVSATGFLNAWIDFNADGDWADAGEQIFTNRVVSPGAQTLSFNVPTGAPVGTSTYARFRFSTVSGLSFVGQASNGEVEDYRITIAEQLDFGDAPDGPYPTLLASNGARHRFLQGEFLGSGVDQEFNGQPNSTATGDDNAPAGLPDDEDGVTFLSALVPGQIATIQVIASIQGKLDAWIDFGRDGSWAQVADHIYAAETLNLGANILTFVVPTFATTGPTYARFRFSRTGGLSFDGPSGDGEVEDYRVDLGQEPLDYSDAPGKFPTLLAADGARHRMAQGVHLGNLIDLEPDGQPNFGATGDDQAPVGAQDDEDGVTFTSAVIPGLSASVQVIASIPGKLDAWLDFNANESWADSGEQIFLSQNLAAGVNNLSFFVPTGTVAGTNYARFRFSREGGLDFKGFAPEGEVEDYLVMIENQPVPCDRSNKGQDFWLAFPANYAPDPDNPIRLTLCIVGMRTVTGTVEIPGLGFSTNFVIPASMQVVIPLPNEADLGEPNDVIQTNGIHVTASDDVAVFGLNKVNYTTDGFLGLPSDIIGKEYVIQAYGNVHTNAPDLNGSQFALVACDDATVVTITPSVTTGARAGGVPYNITLNRGETYQLRQTNGAPNDLSGTLIQADKPVSVFGGHRCANIPNAQTFFCDYIVEQLLPRERAGTNFVNVPLATRTGGDTYRCYATANATTVRLNGIVQGVIDRGEFIERTVIGPAHITSSRPTLVNIYANSSDYDLVVNSDPFQMLLPSTDLFLDRYMICVPDAGFVTNYLTVLVPTPAAGAVSLDGAAIPAAAYNVIPGSGYSGARVGVLPGVHNLIGGGPAAVRFGVLVYGWAEYESYGYPGGMYFTDKTPPTLFCPSNITVVSSANCGATLPTIPVEVSDNCPAPNGIPVLQTPGPGAFLSVGHHPILFSATDVAGNTATCIVDFVVVDPGPITIGVPPTVTLNCLTPVGAPFTYNVSASTPCNPQVPVTCTPPPGSIFPPGTTLVTCSASDLSGNSNSRIFTVSVVDRTKPELCVDPPVIFAAGDTNDNFSGPEPASPSAALQDRFEGVDLRGFDLCSIEQWFAHTLSNLPANIVEARLRIRIQGCGHLPENDTVNLAFALPGGALRPEQWSRRIGTQVIPGLLPTAWMTGSQTELDLDLSRLPNGDGTFTDLLPVLAQLRFLDVFLQDDTAVDYVIFEVKTCECRAPLIVTANVSECGMAVTYALPAFTDLCDPMPVVTCVPASGSFLPVGQHEVVCSAVDASGNSSYCSFAVTVLDQSPFLTIRLEGSNVVVCWSATCVPFTLEHTASLNAPISWTEAPPPFLSGGRYCVTMPTDTSMRFFRLRGL